MTAVLGKPINRVDGTQKVTGGARYSAEITLPNVAYAALVGAAVPSGRVTSIEAQAAFDSGGVIGILTHENLMKVATQPPLIPSLLGQAAPGETFFPMQDTEVHYAGQPVAIVIADSYEQAHFAASLVDVHYGPTPSVTTIEQGRDAAYEAEHLFGGLMPGRMERGDVDQALAKAEVRIDSTFRFAANHHNSIEAPATTAVWDGDRLTLYDSTMGVRATQLTVAALLGIPLADIRVITHFVGGGFGGKAMVWPHVTLAAMAARHVGRPVKLALTRPDAYHSQGHREEQEQSVSLAAGRDGRLTGIRHEKLSITSPFDDWAEPATVVTGQLYDIQNFRGIHRLIKGNTMTPTFTRGPGESVGVFMLETAMDELAYQIGMDPVELRILNHGPNDAMGNPWSSDGLAECLRQGATSFGWASRQPEPRSTRDGNWLIGSGMAAAGYPVAFFMPMQNARVRLYADGSAVVETSTQEIGTGVATIAGQVAAEALGLDVDLVRVEVGDTDLPNTSSAVGSSGAMMVSASVHNAATDLRDDLIAMACADSKSPLFGRPTSTVQVGAGRIFVTASPDVGETYAELLQRNRRLDAEALGSWTPPPLDTPHGLLTFGAHFAEVAVDVDLGLVRVRRMLGVFAPGRVLNPKLARSQLMGGMLWGLGQALLEGNRMDARTGRWVSNNLGEYLVAVNADTPDVTVEFVEVDDPVVGPLGVKGVGEIGQVGSGAAIVNAIFHATGKRVRELPITVEHLLD